MLVPTPLETKMRPRAAAHAKVRAAQLRANFATQIPPLVKALISPGHFDVAQQALELELQLAYIAGAEGMIEVMRARAAAAQSVAAVEDPNVR